MKKAPIVMLCTMHNKYPAILKQKCFLAKSEKNQKKYLTNRDESGIIIKLPKKAARKDRMKRLKKTLKKAKKLLKKVLTNGKECGIIYKLSRQTGCS